MEVILDILNTLNIGYYLLVCSIIYLLEFNNEIVLNEVVITNFLVLFYSFSYLICLINFT